MKRFIFLYVLLTISTVSCSDKVKIKKNMTSNELETIHREMMYDLVSPNGSIMTFVLELAISNVIKQTAWSSAIKFVEIDRTNRRWEVGNFCGSYYSNLINYKNWNSIYVYEFYIDTENNQIIRGFMFVKNELPPPIVKSNGENTFPSYHSFIISNEKELLFIYNRRVVFENERIYSLNNGSNMVEFYRYYGEELSRQLKRAEEQDNEFYMYRKNKYVKKWLN
jgi:hypothetical protein